MCLFCTPALKTCPMLQSLCSTVQQSPASNASILAPTNCFVFLRLLMMCNEEWVLEPHAVVCSCLLMFWSHTQERLAFLKNRLAQICPPPCAARHISVSVCPSKRWLMSATPTNVTDTDMTEKKMPPMICHSKWQLRHKKMEEKQCMWKAICLHHNSFCSSVVQWRIAQKQMA